MTHRSLLFLFSLFAFLALAAPFVFAQQTPADQSVPAATPVETSIPAERADAHGIFVDAHGHPDRPAYLRYMPLIGMGFTALVLWLVFTFVQSFDRNRHETIRKYLDLGQSVPPQLLVDRDNPAAWDPNHRPASDKRKGIITASVGLGVMVMFYLLFGSLRAASLGLIPFCVGLGYLVLAALEPPRRDS